VGLLEHFAARYGLTVVDTLGGEPIDPRIEGRLGPEAGETAGEIYPCDDNPEMLTVS